MEEAKRKLVGNTEGRKERKHSEILDLDSNIETDLKDVGLIHVAQDKDKCWGFEHSNDFSCSVRGGEFIQKVSHISRTPFSMGIAISQPI
jgi:hypothetical protein